MKAIASAAVLMSPFTMLLGMAFEGAISKACWSFTIIVWLVALHFVAEEIREEKRKDEEAIRNTCRRYGDDTCRPTWL